MRRDLELKRFAKDSFINMVSQIVLTLLTVGTSVVVARGLGKEGKGLYSLALILPSLIQIALNLGISGSTVYHVSRRDYDVPTTFKMNTLLSFGLGAIGFIIGMVIIVADGEHLFSGVPTEYLILGLASLPLTYLLPNLYAVLQGLQDFKAYNATQVFANVIMLILFVTFIFVIRTGVAGAVIVELIGDFVAVLPLILLLRRYAPVYPSLPNTNRRYLRDTLSYGLRHQFNMVVVVLLLRVDIVLLNNLGGGAAAVGVYTVAVALAERVWTFSGFAGAVIFPRLMSWKNEEDKRKELALIVIRHTLWLSLVLVVGLLLFGEWAITLIYSSDFSQAAQLLFLLLPGIVMYNLYIVVFPDLYARGKPELISIHAFIALAINILANMILIPRYDAEGAAVATSIAYSYLGLSIIMVFRRMNKARWIDFWMPTHDDIQRMKRIAASFYGKFRARREIHNSRV